MTTDTLLERALRNHYHETADVSTTDGQLASVLVRTSTIRPRSGWVVVAPRTPVWLILAALMAAGLLAALYVAGRSDPAGFPVGALAYAPVASATDGRITIVDHVGDPPRVLAANGFGPRIAPDRHAIAFERFDDGYLVTMDPGGSLVGAFDPAGGDGELSWRWSWTADSTGFVIGTRDDSIEAPAPQTLGFWAIDGRPIRSLATPPGFSVPWTLRPDAAQATSPDGTSVATIACTGCDEREGIWRTLRSSSDGIGWQWLDDPEPQSDRVIAWSPDGTELAIGRTCPTACEAPGVIEIVSAMGASLRHVVLPDVLGPVLAEWSTDGRALGVFAMPNTGDALTGDMVIIDDTGISRVVPLAPIRFIGELAWRATDDRLLFTATNDPDTLYDLWSLDPLTGALDKIIEAVGFQVDAAR